jgi:hypothetical protein
VRGSAPRHQRPNNIRLQRTKRRWHPRYLSIAHAASPLKWRVGVFLQCSCTRHPSRGLIVTNEASFSGSGKRGFLVEFHRLAPDELSEHSVIGHGMSVNAGAPPVPFGWRGGNGWRDKVINPGGSHLLTHGEFNTPRWHQTFDEMSLVIDPRFVADVVEDGLPPGRIEFVSQRSVDDSVIAHCAMAFRAELAHDGPNGVLYAETLTTALVLHLLANYGVAKPKALSPCGKLNSFQLRTVIDFVQSQLADDVFAACSRTARARECVPFCASLPRHSRRATAPICPTAPT